MTQILSQVVYKLSWGGLSLPEHHLYFGAYDKNDAIERCVDQIKILKSSPSILTAYVTLSQLPNVRYPDGNILLSWTKSGRDHKPCPGLPDYIGFL